MTESFILQLEKLASPFKLPSELIQKINSSAVFHFFREGDFILRYGQVCRGAYFIAEGIARSYYENDGKEFTSGFIEKEIINISWINNLNNKASNENIVAVGNCGVLSIDYNTLESLYEGFPVFNTIGRKQAEHSFSGSEMQTRVLRCLSAEERYEWFRKKYPSLMSKVPLKHIASYLGMTDVTLSRLRAKFKKYSRKIS